MYLPNRVPSWSLYSNHQMTKKGLLGLTLRTKRYRVESQNTSLCKRGVVRTRVREPRYARIGVELAGELALSSRSKRRISSANTATTSAVGSVSNAPPLTT